jgi:intracellular septation protein
MKVFFDLFPVILFFIAYKASDIYVATAVAIFATVAQIAWVVYKGRRVEPMLWMSLGIILVFGGATLVLHDETFIKWKPTALYWLFSGVLLGAQSLLRKNLIRSMLEKQISLPEPIWGRLNLSWITFFAAMGLVNLYFAYNYSTEVWVNFKLFGAMGLILLFVVLQGLMLSKYVEAKDRR